MAYKNVSMPKKTHPPGGGKLTAPGQMKKAVPNETGQAPPAMRRAVPNEGRQAPPNFENLADVYRNLSAQDPGFAKQRLDVLGSIMPEKPMAPPPPQAPPPQVGRAIPPLPPWAQAKGVSEEQYGQFLASHPEAPGNRMQGPPPQIPQFPPTGGIRAAVPNEAGQVGPQGQSPPPVPGAGPNVQALLGQGVNPELVRQRMRLAQVQAAPPGQTPGIMPPVQM